MLLIFYLCSGLILAIIVPVFIVEHDEQTKKKKKHDMPKPRGCCLEPTLVLIGLTVSWPIFLFLAVETLMPGPIGTKPHYEIGSVTPFMVTIGLFSTDVIIITILFRRLRKRFKSHGKRKNDWL